MVKKISFIILIIAILSFLASCNYVEGKFHISHSYESNYTFDNEYHWYKCSDCEAIKGQELHTLDEEGFCSVCNQMILDSPDIIYEVSEDGTYATVADYKGSASKVKIANEYNGLPIKSIASKAFYMCNSITSVIIPDSVTSIGDSAFGLCRWLTSVVISDNVVNIGSAPFYCCQRLPSIEVEPGNVKYKSIDGNLYETNADGTLTIIQYAAGKTESSFIIPDNVTEIKGSNGTSIGGAFGGALNLKSVVIPNSVTIIGDQSFIHCRNLESVTIGSSVTSIGDNAFFGCYLPYDVVIPNSVVSIGEYAFGMCDFTSIIISEGVKNIGDYAFYACRNLSSVTIPKSVTSIGENTLITCLSLTDIYYSGSEEQWESLGISSKYVDNATVHYNYIPEEN